MKARSVVSSFSELVHGVGVLLYDVPLVDYNHGGFAFLVYIASYAHVLLAKSLCGIYDDKHNVRPPYSAKGTYDAVALDRFIVNGTLAPDACGVHQHKVIAVPCEWSIYGVACGAGYAAHDRALITQQRVYQAGFAHIWFAHYGDIYGLVLQLLLALRGKYDITSSSRSPMPRPCSADIVMGLPMPKE